MATSLAGTAADVRDLIAYRLEFGDAADDDDAGRPMAPQHRPDLHAGRTLAHQRVHLVRKELQVVGAGARILAGRAAFSQHPQVAGEHVDAALKHARLATDVVHDPLSQKSVLGLRGGMPGRRRDGADGHDGDQDGDGEELSGEVHGGGQRAAGRPGERAL